jgi:SNF2 family DNA or RNA helicase
MNVFPDQRKIGIPWRGDVEQILGPAAQRYTDSGLNYLSIDHTVETVRLLRNMQVLAPSPIQYYYDWVNGTPFESQRVTADLLTIARRAYVLSEMGVGKTRAALWAYDYLRREGLVNCLLVAAPLSTLSAVWENEIFENFPHLTTAVLYGDKKRRLKLLAGKADVFIVNHDGVKVLHQELFRDGRLDCLLIDELASYRNARSDRWKFMAPIVRRSQYAWGLTGSPTPNEPTDAYGQTKLLTPGNAGPSFKSFKDLTMRQVGTFRWIPRDDATDIVYRTMQPSVRFTRAQCFDLPETTYSAREVTLDARAAASYKAMFTDLSAQVGSQQITAANEGVKLSKLLQIACGFAYDAKGQGHFLGGTERFKAIFEIVEESQGKVIVFAPFRYFVELLAAILGKKYPVAMVHGDVPHGQRTGIFNSFQRDVEPRVLVAHPACMAHGLTLTSAATIIWASPTTSLEIYEQANARITRAGQKRQTHIIHIQGTRAEKYIYSRLQRKAKMQGALLDLFREQSED